MLFPLPEPGFLRLDLFGEAFAKGLLFLLELGILELAGLLFSKLAHLHLCLPVVLVMEILCRGDQVKHVGADEERAQFAEVTVVLVLNYTRVSAKLFAQLKCNRTNLRLHPTSTHDPSRCVRQESERPQLNR